MVDARKKAFVAYVVVTGIFVLGLMVYFPVAWLNTVWTHDTLTKADVPYYKLTLDTSQTERYGFHWGWVATDIARFLFAFLMIGFVWYYSIYSSAEGTIILRVSTGLYVFSVIIFILVEAFKTAFIAYHVGFNCSEWQLCRADDGSSPSDQANLIYLVSLALSLSFSLSL